MIEDLLDLVTDANILIISSEHSPAITDLLEKNNYQNLYSYDDFETAHDNQPPYFMDLIIVSAPAALSVAQISAEIEKLNPAQTCPPVLLINHDKKLIPGIDKIIKDFINPPVSNDELLFRIHHLLSDALSNKELKVYNESIVKAIGQRTQELKDSQIEIIECLGYAAEFRDSETGMHTIRVGHYSRYLAKAMGMNDKEAESLLYSAPMHDVGKIGIPDKILLKPGRLEGDEWEIMKQHTTIGERILNRSNNKLLNQASIIALNHHEKWDGSGYPRGLQGSDIHLYGRIVAIVDVFDALTMERPYKKAWSIESAIELINSESGKHFDPSLVELFIDNLTEIKKIKNRYADKNDDQLLNQYIAV